MASHPSRSRLDRPRNPRRLVVKKLWAAGLADIRMALVYGSSGCVRERRYLAEPAL